MITALSSSKQPEKKLLM